MSCPYIPHGANDGEEPPPLPDDVRGEHARVTRAYFSLLPDCDARARALDACRARVERQGSGHCLDASGAWVGCFRERARLTRAHLEACGGDEMVGHEALQKAYLECRATRAGEADQAAAQAACLRPLHKYLACASEIKV